MEGGKPEIVLHDDTAGFGMSLTTDHLSPVSCLSVQCRQVKTVPGTEAVNCISLSVDVVLAQTCRKRPR